MGLSKTSSAIIAAACRAPPVSTSRRLSASIAQVASGRVCRRLTGRFVFVGRPQGGSGLGEYSDVTVAGGAA